MSAGSGPCGRPRGFSLRELGLTLFLLAVVIVAALWFIDLRTKLLVVERDESRLVSALEAASRTLSRDVREAGRGGIPPWEAVRIVADNTSGEGASYLDASGVPVPVRAGTDQLGLRGVLRTPLVAVRLSRGADASGRIPSDASSVWLVASPLVGSDGSGNEDGPRAVVERLETANRRAKRFFLLSDREGRSAVARVAEWRRSGEGRSALEFRLDFADAEAARMNPRGEADAALALGEPATGGLLDDVVWFVARGPAGRSPDYNVTNDPPSMKFPHPFLAAAEFAGNGRWEIARVAEDVEELQVAWEPAGTLRVAWTAKAERRFLRGDGPQPPLEWPPLLNAPAPGSVPDAGPVGWDPDESRRVPFERASKEFVLTPRDAPQRVK
ncbi:MAG: hypothetical protein ABI584_08390 [Acidobacteriota bacterium]